MANPSAQEKAQEFLKTASLYQLGHLPTEQPHSKTTQLSAWAKKDLKKAIDVLKEIDLNALHTLATHSSEIEKLRHAIRKCIESGGRIFLSGCGATGRLSLSLESFWRELRSGSDFEEKVVSFMAGGDIALVRAAENFEDYPDFGARHLMELGFKDGDLLLAITEGGETPFVIGTALKATEVSKVKPWFIYCNPDRELQKIDRSREVLDHPGIIGFCIPTGPMAISGSTRLQASTVLMYAVGLALLDFESETTVAPQIEEFREQYARVDFDFLIPFIEKESQIYAKKEGLFYKTSTYHITVLTDTTERHPTFSLLPFENASEPKTPLSLCYLNLPTAKNTQEAWKQVLKRKPRALEWEGYGDRLNLKKLYGYDFSDASVKRRKNKLKKHSFFSIDRKGFLMRFEWGDARGSIAIHRLSLLEEHLMLKMAINILSCLVMGRLNRYEGNVMTWVKPSNGKLIDRTIRYVQIILQQKGRKKMPSYEQICGKLFEALETFKGDDSIVMKVISKLK